MKCELNPNVQFTMVKQRKMIVKNKNRTTSIEEKITLKESNTGLAELERSSTNFSSSYRGSSVGSSMLTNSLVKLPESPTGLSMHTITSESSTSIEDHPLFRDLTETQLSVYDEFVKRTHQEFDKLNCTIRSVRQVCLDEVNLLRF
jgi:hypothetical protein